MPGRRVVKLPLEIRYQGVPRQVATSVVGVFAERDQAEKALQALKQQGFSEREVSIVGKKDGQAQGGNGGDGTDLGRGTTWGAGLGATAGVLATAGAIAIPGIGPLVALGPLAAALGGAATGGVTGALVDWGIPETRGRQLEDRVKQGQFMAVVEANGQADKAAEVLKNNGAREVEKFNKGAGGR